MRKWSVLRLALVLALVFGQGAVLATAPYCDCDGASMPSMPSHAPAHQMPGMPGSGHHAPCSHPMAPGTCTAMAGCALVAIAAPAGPSMSALPGAAVVAWARVEPPRDDFRGPEPPPPRA